MAEIRRRLGLSRVGLALVVPALAGAAAMGLWMGFAARRTWDEPGLFIRPLSWLAPILFVAGVATIVGGLAARRWRTLGLATAVVGLGLILGITAGVTAGAPYRGPVGGMVGLVLIDPPRSLQVEAACAWTEDVVTDVSGSAWSEADQRRVGVLVGLEQQGGELRPRAIQLLLAAVDSAGMSASTYEWWPSAADATGQVDGIVDGSSSTTPLPGSQPAARIDGLELAPDGRSGWIAFSGLAEWDPGPPDWPDSLSGTVRWTCDG